MAEVIYAKYNKLRRKDFRICTVICEENGERFVKKRPLCPEAEAHLDRMIGLQKQLQNAYPKVAFISAEKTTGGVRFPYLTGTTADSLLAQGMTSAEGLKNSFKEIFQWILPVDKPVNIDCNLDNFLMKDGQIVCLDYEWVTEDEVPVSFLQYRVVHYFYGTHPEAEQLIPEKELLTAFGVDEEEFVRCEEMEKRFQQHVFGERDGARYTDRYRRPMVNPDDRIRWQESQIHELEKVVEHYRQVEGKLRKIGVWQVLKAAQNVGRKIKSIFKK